MTATSVPASATSAFVNSASTTWWFWSGNVPFSYHVSAVGYGQYNAYYGTPGWDYVTYDQDTTDVSNGNAWWLPPDPIYLAEWLQYYQKGYNYVTSYGGQFYISCSHSASDSALCVGDHPNRSFYVVMHVLHVYEGWPANGCCAAQNTHWLN
jgi:hypothetical protein